LQEADKDPDSKPLILWMNGGPGASSLIGAFTELGQLVFNKHSQNSSATTPTLFRNPYAWTTVANVLYLEAPAGVGYSYCGSPTDPTKPLSKCPNNDTSTAIDNHGALVSFFEKFPEYKTRPFYLTGESYAGVYLPMLMDQILQQTKILNVKGVIDLFALSALSINLTSDNLLLQGLQSAMGAGVPPLERIVVT
jgi:carboxypeptidase C (cathepsin A)